MTKTYATLKVLVLCLLLLPCFQTPAKACVDHHPTTGIQTRILFDSTNFQNLIIVISNLNLAGGQPNQFCSCGLNGPYTGGNSFGTIQYVAFVDSGTTNPVQGFDTWSADAMATSAWDNVLQNGQWNGFLADVNQSGLIAGQPVEIYIKVQLQLPFWFGGSLLDSVANATSLGTDEWSASGDSLVASHQSVSGITSGGPATHVALTPGSTFIDDLDSMLVSVRERQEALSFVLYPVPATDRLFVKLVHPGVTTWYRYEVFEATGKMVTSSGMSGPSRAQFALDVTALDAGMYFIRMHSDQGVQTKRFQVTR